MSNVVRQTLVITPIDLRITLMIMDLSVWPNSPLDDHWGLRLPLVCCYRHIFGAAIVVCIIMIIIPIDMKFIRASDQCRDIHELLGWFLCAFFVVTEEVYLWMKPQMLQSLSVQPMKMPFCLPFMGRFTNRWIRLQSLVTEDCWKTNSWAKWISMISMSCFVMRNTLETNVADPITVFGMHWKTCMLRCRVAYKP